MKASKAFKGVKDGDIYPTEFNPGDEIPPELEAAALELEAAEGEGATTAAKQNKAKA